MLETIDLPLFTREQTPASERELVCRAQSGDQDAFEDLYRQYNDRINRYITHIIGDAGIGCELTQDTFLKAWQGLPALHDPTSFMAWLYRIATNKAFNYLHRERKIRLVAWEESTLASLSLSAPNLESRVEDSELIQLVLGRIRPTYRVCLLLYVVEQLPRQQVAQVLGVKVSSIDKYISRSKEAFRRVYYQLNV